MKFIRNYPRLTIAIALILILLAVGNLIRSDKPPAKAQEDIAFFLNNLIWQAEQLGSVLDEGASVVVLDLDRVRFGTSKKNYKRIIKALEKSGVSIQHIEKMVHDDSRGWSVNFGGFPLLEYLEIVEKYPRVDAVISLCGSPYSISAAQKSAMAEMPKLLVTSEQMDAARAESLFEQGIVFATTIARSVQKGEGEYVEYELLRKE